ncbi:hypothetical protein HFO91_34600 [Rhizobium leguminosarum]|uniref:hypothetical protein n=1 Tax=Rhizobium leguminosarum TaxID=384 RepID=UPI001C9631A9|nr:hypothetical protein [Rhizobium leguminosarum]MBY5454674.1 hypothetical protein [Rhizobium leguminosarum]
MSEFTVTIEPYYANWQGNGERPIWHTHLEASSTDEAVEFERSCAMRTDMHCIGP